ncbi:MAG: hypothetical protein H6510_05555 [Acidobacteria bacterium]|nr:hypothetical protein [Acidobacteriota bacterium]MCB9397260.1 hypothetical protein [Acidobacteriota bacterium]
MLFLSLLLWMQSGEPVSLEEPEDKQIESAQTQQDPYIQHIFEQERAKIRQPPKGTWFWRLLFTKTNRGSAPRLANWMILAVWLLGLPAALAQFLRWRFIDEPVSYTKTLLVTMFMNVLILPIALLLGLLHVPDQLALLSGMAAVYLGWTFCLAIWLKIEIVNACLGAFWYLLLEIAWILLVLSHHLMQWPEGTWLALRGI